jgi:DNA-binding GntR family transcriptional regulator
LIRLENEGLVEQVPRVGIFVRVPKVRELLELHEMRRLLESYAAAKAARRIDREQLAELKRLCGVLREAALEEREAKGRRPAEEIIRAGVVADVSFHLLIMQAAGNRRLMRMVSSMHLMSRLCGHNWSNPKKHTRIHQAAHTYLDHMRIYRALARRDAVGARYWMRRHIRPKREVADDLRRLHHNLVHAPAEFQDWPESVRAPLRAMEKFESEGVSQRG